MPKLTHYDAIILGAGHNALVAASYLGRAGFSVLILEKNDYIGGATTSQQLFPEFDARISRYSYLVSLFPQQLVRELGLNVEFRRREISSFTPYRRGEQRAGLLLSNVSDEVSRASLRELVGSNREFEGMRSFYNLARTFADEVWDHMLQPLPTRQELEIRLSETEEGRLAWRCLIEEPIGQAIERHFQSDLMRGVGLTDAKIGLFTHAHDPMLLQNRCFLYHVIGNRTGDWRVPVGGMGRVADELSRVAREANAEMITHATVTKVERSRRSVFVEWQTETGIQRAEGKVVLSNFGQDILRRLLEEPASNTAADEGSVLKVNMLLRRLPQLRSGQPSEAAFGGTFHIDESYEQMKVSYAQALGGRLPEKIPCEIYCHTLTDDSILSPALRREGFHTLTLFGLDVPWSLFAKQNESTRTEATKRCLAQLNEWLQEPIEHSLARTSQGELCIESKSPVDIERELGHYRGNIFHSALKFPFAASPEEAGRWGVETPWPNILLCGSSAKRGGAVSGIPGHNAARKAIELLRT